MPFLQLRSAIAVRYGERPLPLCEVGLVDLVTREVLPHLTHFLSFFECLDAAQGARMVLFKREALTCWASPDVMPYMPCFM